MSGSRLRPFLAACFTATAVAAQPLMPPVVVDFEGGAPDAASFCEPSLTGGGAPVAWTIAEDATAPAGPRVLAETSGDRTGNRFPLCIFAAPVAADVEVSVRFRAVGGRVDQAAGVIVRLRDADNYYVVRANALEGNVRFYKVEAGRRIQLGGADVPVPGNTWQTLGLRIVGGAADIFFNGAVLFTVTDGTFAEAGRVGVWTKSDSLTYFDGFTATVLR